MAMTRSQSRCEREASGSSTFLTKLTAKWLQPVLRPRLAMGVAVTILSFAAVERCTELPGQHIQPVDFKPIRIWHAADDTVIRVKDRAVKYYENIRFVYQLERRLKDLQEHEEVSERQRASAPRPESERRNDWPGELASRKHAGQLAQCSERGR